MIQITNITSERRNITRDKETLKGKWLYIINILYIWQLTWNEPVFIRTQIVKANSRKKNKKTANSRKKKKAT